jgi:hypothetical protein
VIGARVAGMFQPSLAPPAYKPIEDKEPQVAAMVKDVYARASRGTLSADEFDASFWAKISGQLTAARLFALAAGPIASIALVERKDDGTKRLYRYRLAVKDKTWLVLVGLGADGKICELTAELAEE